MANQDFTLAFWLKFPTAPTGDYWHYLDLYPCATNNTRLEFYNVQGNMYGRFTVPDGAGGSHTVYKLLGAHGLDAWHHYALTRKGTTVTFYFDGASAGSDTDANNYRNLIDSGDMKPALRTELA